MELWTSLLLSCDSRKQHMGVAGLGLVPKCRAKKVLKAIFYASAKGFPLIYAFNLCVAKLRVSNFG